METAFVTPKSKKAVNRFHNLMGQIDECFIEQIKGNKVFLRSMNGKYFFWVNIHSDSDWLVEL